MRFLGYQITIRKIETAQERALRRGSTQAKHAEIKGRILRTTEALRKEVLG